MTIVERVVLCAACLVQAPCYLFNLPWSPLLRAERWYLDRAEIRLWTAKKRKKA